MSTTRVDTTTNEQEMDATDGNDTGTDSAMDDVLNRLGGDEKLFGNDGNDQLFGGQGNDLLEGGSGADALSGDAGNDTLTGGSGNDVLLGGDGDDKLSGDDVLFGDEDTTEFGNLVADGSFANTGVSNHFQTLTAGTPFSSWKVESGTVDFIGTYREHNGAPGSFDLDGSSPGAISQKIATEPGMTYTVKFDMAGNGDGGLPNKSLQLSADGRGAGNDVAFFAGNRVDHDVIRNADGTTTVIDRSTADGVDRVINVESLRFADQTLVDDQGSWTLQGSTGNDNLAGTRAADIIDDGAGNDTIMGSAGADKIDGGEGVDTIIGSTQIEPLKIEAVLAQDKSLTFNPETGKFYKEVTAEVTFNDATLAAQNTQVNEIAGRLVTIRSAAENAFVDKIAGSSSVWIGDSDAGKEEE